VPERQRTLRATIEWSYELLGTEERRLFVSVAVFAGSFDIEAAESVADADLDGLASLIDKSLLRRTADGRFFMLETIREFALEQLAELDEATALRDCHAAFYLEAAAVAERGLRTPQHAAWLARLAAERDNVRAAIETLLDRRGEDALRLATSMWRFWEARGATEGRHWLARALGSEGSEPAVRGRAHYALGRLAFFQGDYEQALASFGASADLAREADDIEALILALGKGSWVYEERGQPRRALALAEEALELADQVEDSWVRAEALNDVGAELCALADPRSEDLLKQSLSLRRATGDEQNVADSLNNLGWAALVRGAYPEARAYLEESLDISRRLEDEFHVALALDNLGLATMLEGRYREAVELLSETVELSDERGDQRIGAEALLALAGAFAGTGEAVLAVRLGAAADGLFASMGTDAWPVIRERIGPLIADARSQLADAETIASEGRALSLAEAAELARSAIDDAQGTD
jgi:tetratricopeptide (TPR) repeat protein